MDDQWANFMRNFIQNEELFDDFDDQLELMITEQMHRQQSEASNTRRHRRFIERDREARHQRLFNEYFVDNPVYSEEMFR